MQRYYVFIAALVIFSLAAVGMDLVMSQGPVADQKRVNDLSVISEGVTLWVIDHHDLPASLNQLKTRPLQAQLSDYTYQTAGVAQYKLCTTFRTDRSMKGGLANDVSDVYDHGQGYQCFTYRVPELEVPVVTPVMRVSPKPVPSI